MHYSSKIWRAMNWRMTRIGSWSDLSVSILYQIMDTGDISNAGEVSVVVEQSLSNFDFFNEP